MFNSVYKWKKRKEIKRKKCKDVKVAITDNHKHSKLVFQEADMLNHPLGIKILSQQKSSMINSIIKLCLNIAGDQGLMPRNYLPKP